MAVITRTHMAGDEVSAAPSGSWWKAFVSEIDGVTVPHMPNRPAENGVIVKSRHMKTF